MAGKGRLAAALGTAVPLLTISTGLFAAQAPDHATFTGSAQCIACHSNLVDADGENVSIGHGWRSTMMAHSARDPYWQASVRREMLDHPALHRDIEDTCSTCHMPMARALAAARGEPGRVFAHLDGEFGQESVLALDGVSCTVCHRMDSANFGEESSFDGGFLIAAGMSAGTAPPVYGPFDVDDGRRRVMSSASGFTPETGVHIQQSELCATCHTLFTRPAGAAPGERFPEQVSYLEWRHSGYAGERSCQDCHMPEAAAAPISSVLGEPRDGLSRHAFRGGNAFMLRLLDRYRDDLGITAPAAELQGSATVTEAHLRNDTARLQMTLAADGNGDLVVDVEVHNLAGHKLPTAYPSRRAWLHLAVRDADGRVLFESGALRANGAIAGNDNDADPLSYEPHYTEISRPGQVQIYEPVLADRSGSVTTGLLNAVRYLKDNRLLPSGFDKASAGAAIRVRGAAGVDPDFTAGSDRVRYRITLDDGAGEVRVAARLLFQSIGFRWAENLSRYDSVETNRFVGYYRANSNVSAMELAATGITRHLH
ncbi:MAG: hypothetical protein OXQ29_04335 [Rhodospirillaceae bacterium]|nr:hypothetical protein [Rhodospirillaceae bacterium]